jgi:hypothetical protein
MRYVSINTISMENEKVNQPSKRKEIKSLFNDFVVNLKEF